MVLNKNNVVDYLNSNGFNECEIIQIRNLRNFCAIVNTDSGKIVVKQQGGNEDMFSFVSLDSELNFYKYYNKSIKKLIPKVYNIDFDKCIIIIEFIDNFYMFNNYDTSNLLISINLGQNLALIHKSFASNSQKTQKVKTQNYFRYFDVITPELFNNGSVLFEKCVKLMQKFPDLNESLRVFEKEFTWDCFIHGDLKNDNFFVNETKVKFIDWELSGIGDRYLDMGFIVGNYLLFWIEKYSFDLKKEIDNDKYLAYVKEHIYNFTYSYAKKLDTDFTNLNYEKIVKFAGVFLLNVFYSKSVFKNEYSKQDIMALEYGRKMLVFPEKFIIELFFKNMIHQNARNII